MLKLDARQPLSVIILAVNGNRSSRCVFLSAVGQSWRNVGSFGQVKEKKTKKQKQLNKFTHPVNDMSLQSGCAHSTAAGAGFPTRADPG